MEDSKNVKDFAFPYSYQIMGTIVDALDLKDRFLIGSTANRFFQGESVNKYDLKEIYLAFGNNIVESGIIPIPPDFIKHNVSMSAAVSESVARFFIKWDRLLAIINSHSSRDFDSKEAVKLILRLVIIDLSLRVFALFRMAKLPVPKPHTPSWVQYNAGGNLLRDLLSQARISREQLSARTGVSPTSIDNWFDGKIIPKPDNISALAKELAIIIPNQKEQYLKIRITREFGFSYLSNKVAGVIGPDAVKMLATSLYRIAWEINEDVNQMNRPPIEEGAGVEYEVLIKGCDAYDGHTLLRNLAMVTSDTEWQRDIMACSVSWDSRFQEVINECAPPKTAAGLAQDVYDVVPDYQDEAGEDLTNFSKTNQFQAQDYLMILKGDLAKFNEILDVGIAGLKMIVRQHPMSPKAHLSLGSYLGMAGKWRRNCRLIDDGISECNIAAAIFPNWDNPVVEPAIMLGNAGYHSEALKILEQAEPKLGKMTPHLAFCQGYTLMELGRFKDALSKFKTVIESSPDYALAYDHASHCAFKSGNRNEGRELAKKARNLGESQAFRDWKRGEYDK